MHKITISILQVESFTNIKYEATLDQVAIAQEITQHSWCPAVFKERYRTIENATHTDLVVLDIDQGCTLTEAQTLFADYWHVIGTSRNHQKAKGTDPACDRFRVLLLLDEPITNDVDFKATFAELHKKFPFVDPICKDISRFFYPCTSIVSVNPDLLGTVPVIKGNPHEHIKVESRSLEHKGRLLVSTMDFFFRGAPEGERNTMLFQAAADAKEQGYSYEEVEELVKQTGEKNGIDNFYPELHEKHRATLERVYRRPSTNPVRLESVAEEKKFLQGHDLISGMWEYLNDRDAVKGDSTGIPGMDDLLGGGFRLGEITVLQGEAKTGKNTLYHFIQSLMLPRGIAQGYASRELIPSKEVLPNYLSLLTKKNAWTSTFTEEEIAKANSQIASWPIYFTMGYGPMAWEEIKAWMDELHYRGVNHFWMDHLHYMLEDDDHKLASRFMRNLKKYVIDNNTHVNLIVQPTKIGREEKIGLSSLKGGAAVGQTLDNLFLFTRGQPSDTAKPIQNCSTLELSHARHKLAKPGKIYLQYNPNDTTYTELKGIVEDPEHTQDPAYRRFREKFGDGKSNGWKVN